MTITSHNQVFTQMNVAAKIFHIVTTLPFFWAGAGILGLTGLLTLAIFYQHTAAGKLARKILPVERAGLGWSEPATEPSRVFGKGSVDQTVSRTSGSKRKKPVQD